MSSRRNFLKTAAVAGLSVSIAPKSLSAIDLIKIEGEPKVISTWKHGLAANEAAWKILEKGGLSIDAVEQGVRVSESDPEVTSVGYGGLPDRDGNVTLDACIMDDKGNCGSVAFLQNIKNPISVARLVMEKTPHIMLAGEGAKRFAIENSFKEENLLTDNAKKKWLEWVKENKYKPYKIDKKNHDTIGMLAMDKHGNLAGACTTSGLAWKYHGRVGDSPLIGAGLYVDNEVGAATATGKGEAVIKIAGSFLIVELMRNGRNPQEACEEAIERIIKKQPDHKEFQVGFLALNKAGETGAFSLDKGFQYAKHTLNGNNLEDADSYLK